MSPILSVSVIIPVYNEEQIIESSVRTNFNLLTQYNCDFEILIVNDGSRDQSNQIINHCFSEHPNILIFQKAVNEGFGSAVKLGIQLAQKKFILCVPADSPLKAEVLESFIKAAHHADIIVGYRVERLGYSWRMKLNSAAFHFIVKNLFDIHLRDFNWIHMYNRRVFSENGIGITSKGLFMLAEVLISAKRKGYSFYEIPVLQTQRITGVATASMYSTVIMTLKEIIAYKIILCRFKNDSN